MITFDRSDRYTLIVCDQCPHWHAFAWDRDDAERRAAAHEESCHPGVRVIRSRSASRDTTRRARAQSAQCDTGGR